MHTHNITLSENLLIPNLWIEKPVDDDLLLYNVANMLKFFDKDGYELTPLELCFYNKAEIQLGNHLYNNCCQIDWYTQPSTNRGLVLDHSMLLHRYGFAGDALKQLKKAAVAYPIINKMVNTQPKWGIDFSLDWVDNGSCIEVLHYEFDSRDVSTVQERKDKIEHLFSSIDWEDAVSTLIDHQAAWEGLQGMEQTDWKARFFGLPKAESAQKTW